MFSLVHLAISKLTYTQPDGWCLVKRRVEDMGSSLLNMAADLGTMRDADPFPAKSKSSRRARTPPRELAVRSRRSRDI
jgi:hypothetical protein